MLLAAVRTHARFRGDASATIESGRVLNWRDLTDRVSRIASGLTDRGVAAGDRVGILGLNSGRYLEAELATWWLGAVVVPLNTRSAVEEHGYALTDSGMTALIVDRHFVDVGRTLADGHPGVHLLTMQDGGDLLSLDGFARGCTPASPVETPSDALGGIFYTGGTTGAPKGVMLSHSAIWTAAIAVALPVQLSGDSVMLHAAPMFHLADAGLGHAALIVGATNSFVPRFDPADVLATIERDRVTVTLLVPTMIGMLLADPGFDAARVGSLQTLCFGASPITGQLLHDLRIALPDLSLLHCYGQTEMGPIISYLDSAHQVPDGPKALSIGKPFPSVEVRIVGDDGADLPPGQSGEILARGPSMMSGYWRKPEATADTIVDGWIRTGDIATMDADGFMFIHDRAKDMIITGGENVFSAEVENAIASHPSVAQVAVIGIPDQRFGEQVHAVLVLHPGHRLSHEELIDHCRPAIANYKWPRSMVVRTALPISATGKVLKRELREPYWAGRDRSVN